MKSLIAVILFFSFTQSSYAKWLCHQTASIKEDNTILACGVGEAPIESKAREIAFQNAKKEFDMLCRNDVKCQGFKTEVNPLRNSCEKRDGSYKCYRGLEFKITSIRGASADLSQLDEELAQKQKEYDLAKKKYEKKQKIDELKRKIEEKDFKEEKNDPAKPYIAPDDKFFMAGISIAINSVSTPDASARIWSSGITLKYLPFKQVGFQFKAGSVSGLDNEPSDSSDSLTADIPKTMDIDGNLSSLSVQYYFSKFSEAPTVNWFVGFGFGRFSYDYFYEYEDSSFDIQIETGSESSPVTHLSIGGTTTGAFLKKGNVGFDFGIDIDLVRQGEGDNSVDQVTQIYTTLLWGF